MSAGPSLPARFQAFFWFGRPRPRKAEPNRHNTRGCRLGVYHLHSQCPIPLEFIQARAAALNLLPRMLLLFATAVTNNITIILYLNRVKETYTKSIIDGAESVL
jgi:hypothetical protein